MRTVALLHAGVWLLIGAVSNPWFVQAWIHPVERLSIRILFGAAGAACVLIGGLIAYKRDDRGFQAKASLISISGLAALIASEGLARVAGHSEARLLEPDSAGTGGYRLAKNVALDVHVDNRKIHIATNSEGMRWRQTSGRRAPGAAWRSSATPSRSETGLARSNRASSAWSMQSSRPSSGKR